MTKSHTGTAVPSTPRPMTDGTSSGPSGPHTGHQQRSGRGTVTTEAWILRQGDGSGRSALETGDFSKGTFEFSLPGANELLVEPLFGCWEGNMSHAIQRSPIDVCHARKEPAVVLGNSGVMRVLEVGGRVRGIAEGDVGLMFANHEADEYGYMLTALGYDAPGSMGILAKRSRIPAHTFVPLPKSSRFSLEQWAAFSVRYITAWDNWRVAFGAYRLQMSERDDPRPYVLGWGGGSTLAELDLARRQGCEVAMISGDSERLALICRMGIKAIDRRNFPDIQFDPKRYDRDPAYKKRYRASRRTLLDVIERWTGGRGVAIFIDYIGGPLWRPTREALGRQGVLTTAGWQQGMHLQCNRAIECINRHIHVHTHYARRSVVHEAMEYAERTGWMPEVSELYDWNDVHELARVATEGRLRTYFPVYRVHRPSSWQEDMI